MVFIPPQIAAPTLVLSIILFLLKHFLADFALQSNWMAQGKAGEKHWLLPLFVHASIHGLLTFVLSLILAPQLWWLSVVDFAVHFSIDRSKALASRYWHAEPNQPLYWWLFGADQTLHHLTHLSLALLMASNA